MSRPIRSAALLLDTEQLQWWERTAIERMAAETSLRIDLIVVNNASGHSTSKRGLLQTMAEMDAWDYYRAYRRRRGPIPARERSSIDTVACLGDAERVQCEPIPVEPLGTGLPPDIVDRLGATDVAIRFGFGILKGGALQAPEAGTLSFHGGDLRRYRGRPAGFWEFLHGEDHVGITLQRLSETLDGGEIVAFDTVSIQDKCSWPAVQQAIFEATPELFVTGIRNLEDPSITPEQPPELGELYSNPGLFDVGRYGLKACWQTLGRPR